VSVCVCVCVPLTQLAKAVTEARVQWHKPRLL